MSHPSPFKNSQGMFLLMALFYETTLKDKSTVLYTLKDRDHEGYPSLYRLYMEMGDFTEYEFAKAYLDGWSHWKALCGCKWFKEYVERWREELYLRDAAKRLRAIQRLADTSGRDALSAQTYLLEKKYLPKIVNTKGRPSKEDIKREAKELAINEKQLQEDFNRIQERMN